MFALSLLFFSCKKDDEKGMEIASYINDVTIWTELSGFQVAPNHLLDSTECKLYIQGAGVDDTSLVDTKYSGKDGRVTFKMEKHLSYRVVAKTRTYKFSYNVNPHYYTRVLQLNYLDYGYSDTYNYPSITTYFESHHKMNGYGCTDYYIQDPTE